MLTMLEFYEKKNCTTAELARMFRVSDATVYRWRCNDPQPPMAVLLVINNWDAIKDSMGPIGEEYDYHQEMGKLNTSKRIERDRVRRAATRRKEGRPAAESNLPMSAQDEAKIYETGTVNEIVAHEKRKRKPASLPPPLNLSNPKGYAAEAAAKEEPSFM